LQPFHVALQGGAPVLPNGLHRLQQVSHALAQFALNASAFFLAHLVETIESFVHPGQHCRFKIFTIRRAGGGIQRTGYPQDGVEIGLGRKRKLSRRRLKRRQISCHQRTVQRKGIAGSALQAQRNFDMPTRDFFFQQPPQLHLQRIRARRQPEVQVQKAVVH
jgi:hypothetical protein